jgi:hypothetical protein
VSVNDTNATKVRCFTCSSADAFSTSFWYFGTWSLSFWIRSNNLMGSTCLRLILNLLKLFVTQILLPCRCIAVPLAFLIYVIHIVNLILLFETKFWLECDNEKVNPKITSPSMIADGSMATFNILINIDSSCAPL